MEEHFAEIKGIDKKQREPIGLNAAMQINNKRQVARELDLDQGLQSQFLRGVEQTLAFREKMDALYVGNMARMNEIGSQSMESFTKSMNQMHVDNRVIGIRKELKSEERSEEMEESFNKAITSANQGISGVNSEMVGINAAIAEAVGGAISGVIQELIASGKLKAGEY